MDSLFDDRAWTDEWLRVPVALVPPGSHPSGYHVERHLLTQVEIFGSPYLLSTPHDCRVLYDPSGRLWMSTTPQEHIMMVNNGRHARGQVLVGGLGLGLYPQYAVRLGQATHLTVVERSREVCALVEPTLRAALEVPLDLRWGLIEDALAGAVTVRYDTIFLDTWDTLDAAQLPAINRLRALARRHLAPGGRVLLWGYGWMISLFLAACRQLLMTDPAQRPLNIPPQAAALLAPVLEHFRDRPVFNLNSALHWCHAYATAVQESDLSVIRLAV
jgi:hypothetical protein